MMDKIGFGGGCHWCTEAVFQSLKNISKVEQGWIASSGQHAGYSEAVIVHYDDELVGLDNLVEVHLHTHSCTSNHHMRHKYRSAVYFFSRQQEAMVKAIIQGLQQDFAQPVITLVLPFVSFKMNSKPYLDYYFSDPGKAFCSTVIKPKLKLLQKQFPGTLDASKLVHDL